MSGGRGRPPEGVLKLALMAVLWFLGAAVLASLTAALVLMVAQYGWHVPFTLGHFILVLAPATQIFLLVAALRRGARVGDGNIAEGLGWAPIRRRLDVGLLAVAAAVLAMGHVAAVVRWPAYRAFFDSAKTSLPMPDDVGIGTSLYLAWVVGIVVIGAPLSEELFFRGWLWVGLRRWWGVETTALVTGGLWLVAHVSDGGWKRVMLLVPTMILVCIARAIGGSVKASMLVHAANNAVLSAVLVAGKIASG